MDYNDFCIDPMKYAGDFWFPTYDSFALSGGGGKGKNKRPIGAEQIRKKDKDWKPEIIRTDEYLYPRIQKFYEWEQFLDWVDWSGKEYRRISQRTTRAAYNNTLTWNFQEAMNLARYGWAEGLEKIKELDKLDLSINESFQQNYDIKTKYDIAGGAVNIGRYLSGVPDCMRCMHISNEHSLPARVQKIFIIGNIHMNITANQILHHGYKIYQIIEALEMANVQTDITLAFGVNKNIMHSEHDYYFYETYIKIKKTEDVMYPEKMLFCVAHPSMFRRLRPSERERNSYLIRDLYKFYYDGTPGYGTYIPEWMPPYNLTKGALVIPDLIHEDKMTGVIDDVKNLIQSQYDKIR